MFSRRVLLLIASSVAAQLGFGCGGGQASSGTFVETVGSAPPATSIPARDSTPAPIGASPSKRADCSRVVEIINSGVDKLGLLQHAGDLGVMASAMDRVADDVERTKVSNTDLAESATRYARMARSIAVAARSMKTALEEKNAEAMTSSQAALDRATDPESALVEHINEICAK